MVRFLVYLLLLVGLSSCTQSKLKTPEFYQFDKIDSVCCYSHVKNKEITIKDTIVLNTINNCIKRSVLHRNDYLVKFPPFYGTITIFCNGASLKFDVLGNALKQNNDVYLECSTNVSQMLDSLVFK